MWQQLFLRTTLWSDVFLLRFIVLRSTLCFLLTLIFTWNILVRSLFKHGLLVVADVHCCSVVLFKESKSFILILLAFSKFRGHVTLSSVFVVFNISCLIFSSVTGIKMYAYSDGLSRCLWKVNCSRPKQKISKKISSESLGCQPNWIRMIPILCACKIIIHFPYKHLSYWKHRRYENLGTS